MNLIVLVAIKFNSTEGILVKIVTCIRIFFGGGGGDYYKVKRGWEGITKLFGLVIHIHIWFIFTFMWA